MYNTEQTRFELNLANDPPVHLRAVIKHSNVETKELHQVRSKGQASIARSPGDADTTSEK